MGPIDWDALVVGPVVGVFGEAVAYVPVSGAPRTITGIFDDGYLAVPTIDPDTDAVSSQPTLGVQVSQFAQPPAVNDTLTLVRTGQGYIVNNVRIDSHGMARLMLNETA